MLLAACCFLLCWEHKPFLDSTKENQLDSETTLLFKPQWHRGCQGGTASSGGFGYCQLFGRLDSVIEKASGCGPTTASQEMCMAISNHMLVTMHDQGRQRKFRLAVESPSGRPSDPLPLLCVGREEKLSCLMDKG